MFSYIKNRDEIEVSGFNDDDNYNKMMMMMVSKIHNNILYFTPKIIQHSYYK